MIGLSPLSTGHPLRFQPKWVRPSTGSYPRFSLPMDSSPGFASAACDSLAILKARFRCGSFENLTSPHTATRWLILQKARRHNARLLRLLVGARFQVLFHSPLGVLFTFPSRYLCAIGHRRVFSLGGWSPRLRTGFHVPGPTRVPARPGVQRFAYGAVTRFGRPFHAGSAALPFVTGPAGREPADGRSHNPHAATPRRLHAHGFGLVRFRSPLLAQSRLISLPRGT